MHAKKAIWFSRHHPTESQISEALHKHGFEIIAIPQGMTLGAVDYDGTEATNVFGALKALAAKHGAKAVFGVFPTHILSIAWHDAVDAVTRGDWLAPIELWSAVNFKLAVTGQPATFAFGSWRLIAMMEAIRG